MSLSCDELSEHFTRQTALGTAEHIDAVLHEHTTSHQNTIDEQTRTIEAPKSALAKQTAEAGEQSVQEEEEEASLQDQEELFTKLAGLLQELLRRSEAQVPVIEACRTQSASLEAFTRSMATLVEQLDEVQRAVLEMQTRIEQKDAEIGDQRALIDELQRVHEDDLDFIGELQRTIDELRQTTASPHVAQDHTGIEPQPALSRQQRRQLAQAESKQKKKEQKKGVKGKGLAAAPAAKPRSRSPADQEPSSALVYEM
jgi:chromosome segregation ATPase